MTVAITLPPSPPPTREDPANFAVRADAHHAWLVPAVGEMNDQNAENNSINANVSTKYGELIAAGLQYAAANALTATAQATAALTHASNAATSASQASASATSAAASATSAGSAATAAAQVLIGAVTQRPALRPSLSVDWTLRPTAAALTAAGWTISRTGEMTYFGAVPVKVAENLFVRSQDFGNASWAKTSLVAPAAVTDESGFVGSTVIAAAGAGQHALGELTTSTNLGSQTYRVRFLCKAATYTKAIIADRTTGRAAAAFDLAAGTTIASTFGAGYTSHSVEAHELGGGLYWCNLVMTSSAAGTNWEPTIVGYPDSGATLSATGASYTGDGTSGIEVYAAQLQHNFDGDYVPTTDTPITQYASPLLTAAANELAYQHNSRGECVGLLQYPADTNLILQSQNLGTTWAGVGIAVSLTKRLWAGVAPFWRIAKNTTGTNANIFQDITFTALSAATPYTVTTALLADQWSATSRVRLSIYSNTAGTTPSGQIVVISGPGTVVGSNVVSGLSTTTPTLVRYTTTLPIGTGSIRLQIFPDESTSTTLGAAILATRVHLSASPRYMPYIKTDGSQATRNAQAVSLGSGGNPLGPAAFAAVNNPVEGTLLTRASVEDLMFDQQRRAIGLAYAGASDRFLSFIGTNGSTSQWVITTLDGGVQLASTAFGTVSTTPSTVAYAYEANRFQPAANGVVAAADNTGSVPIVNQLWCGTWLGLLQRTELYPRAMTSTELAAITTPGVLV